MFSLICQTVFNSHLINTINKKNMIKKLSLLPFFIFIFSSSFSQEAYLDSIKKIIEKDFAQIKPADFKKLVPYKTEEGTGYLNSSNNKKMVRPDYYELDFAKPNVRGNYNNVAYFEIDSKTNEIQIFLQNWEIFQAFPSENKPISKGYSKGFHVVNNAIFSYSESYSYCPNLFKYKGENFAVAIKNDKYAVINPDGETLTNLGFDYSDLDLINLGNDDIFFKYKTTNGELGFITMKGEKHLVNDVISNSSRQTQGYFSFIDSEHSVKRNYYGYSIESNDELSGVLDLMTMKWIIKPQKAFKIEEINYTTDENLSDTNRIEDRKNLKFYFLVRDKKNENAYYIDSKMRKYLPKK